MVNYGIKLWFNYFFYGSNLSVKFVFLGHMWHFKIHSVFKLFLIEYLRKGTVNKRSKPTFWLLNHVPELANIQAQNVCMCLGCLVTSECLALMSFLFISNTNISYLNTLHNGNWS